MIHRRRRRQTSMWEDTFGLTFPETIAAAFAGICYLLLCFFFGESDHES
jgi:hypothetical protein